MSFNQNSGTAVPILINSSQVLVTGNAASANALTVRQFGAGNVFSASNASGTTALFVGANGNVGIGTTSPVAPLSTFFATSGIPNTTGSGTSNVATRFQTGSVCLDMGNISNGNMWLQNHLDTNWATNYPLLLNPNGGFVGIGVTNPQVLLAAVGTCTLGTGAGATTAAYHTGMVNIIGGSTRALLRIENNNSVGSPGIIFGEGGGFTEDTQPTIKKVQGTNNLAIMCGGNVGIGTATNLASPLVIYNPASTSTYTGTTAWGNLHLMPQGTDNSWAGITFGGSGGGTIQQSTQASIVVDSSATNGTKMRFNVGYLFANGAIERMTILGQTGNVGIGTTSPGYILEVSNSTATTSTSFLGLTNPYVFGFNTGLNIGSSIVYSSRWQGDGVSGVVEMCKIDGRKEQNANFGDSYLAFQTRYVTDRVNGGAGTLTEKMRITGNGNVGIGTATPGSALEVNGVMRFTGTSTSLTGINLPAGGAGIHWGNGYSRILDDGDLRICTDDNMHFYTGCNASSLGTERITLLNSGNVGIGTTSPNQLLDVNGTIATRTDIRWNGTGLNAADKKLYSPADGDLEWMTSTGAGVRGFAVSHQGTKIVYLNTSGNSYLNGGNVGIGTASPGFPLEVVSVATNNFTASYGFYSGSGLTTGITGNQSVGAKISGYVWSTNGFLATSDARIKIVNPEPISNCLDAVNKLRVCKYEYIDKITDKSNKLGFIAQEVQKAIPESVTMSESIVPNIFKMSESVQSNVITIAEHGLVVGDTVKLVYGSGAVETNVCVVRDTSTFQVEAEIKDESVFVYGKKVNDFLTLDHTQVFTCAIGAIQELSAENTALKSRLDSLEQRLATAGL